MKSKLHLLALVAITALITACASGTSALSGTKPYPLKVCLVTDNDLDSMGDQQVRTYNGQQIKFCCETCIGKFEKNPAKYLAKLPQ